MEEQVYQFLLCTLKRDVAMGRLPPRSGEPDMAKWNKKRALAARVNRHSRVVSRLVIVLCVCH